MSIKQTVLQIQSNDSRISRRRFFSTLLGASLIPCVCGCSTTKSQKKKKNEEFEEEESDADDARKRDQSSELSDYVAKTGRGSKEKKKLSKGDTFLMSDTAKEIYANTER